jgi:hypothetical protein
LLVVAACERQLIPIDLVRDAFGRAGEPKKLLELECGHFDVYPGGTHHEDAVSAAEEWFHHPPLSGKPMTAVQRAGVVRHRSVARRSPRVRVSSTWQRETPGLMGTTEHWASWPSPRSLRPPSPSAMASPAGAATPGQVVITEWQYNGSEFVELTNVGGEPVDMSTYSYDDDSRLAGTVR